MKTLSNAIALIGCLLMARHARADPSPSNTVEGMDNPEARAEVLLAAMRQFAESRKHEYAYEAATAAARLHPTMYSVCASGAFAYEVKRFVEATEYMKNCIEHAVRENCKQRNPKRWEMIQGDYELSRSRVGAVRVHAPPLTHVYVGGKDKGFADETREIFVEPDMAHTIVGIGIAATMHTSVTLSRGESLHVYLKADEPAPRLNSLACPSAPPGKAGACLKRQGLVNNSMQPK